MGSEIYPFEKIYGTNFYGSGANLNSVNETDTFQSVTNRNPSTNASLIINNGLLVNTTASNFISQRVTTATAGIYTALALRHKTTNNSALSNGFGTGFTLGIENASGYQVNYGMVSASRDGSDLNGKVQISAVSGGSYVNGLDIRADQRVTIYNNLTGTNSNMSGLCTANSYAIQGGAFSVASTGWTSATGYYVTNTNNPIYTTSSPTAGSLNIEARFAGGWINIIPTATGRVNISNAVATTLNVTQDLFVDRNVKIGGNVSFKRPYGMFSSNQTQTLASASTAYPITFNNIEDSYEIYKTADNANFSFGQTGDYLIELSAIFSTSVANKDAEIWVQKNGVNVIRSNTKVEIAGTGEQVVSVPFILDMNMTDSFRVMWAGESTGVQMLYTTNTSYSPETPSIIMTISKISELTP